MSRFLVALVVLTIAFIFVTAVFYWQVWPHLFDDRTMVRHDGLTLLGARISEFQTLIGGALAAFAALVTAISIFAANAIPSWLEERRMAEEREVMRQIGAARLSNAVTELLRQILVELTDYAKSSKPISWNFVIPPDLENVELLRTQPDQIGRNLCLALHALIPPLQNFDETDEEYAVAQFETLDRAHDHLRILDAHLRLRDFPKTAKLAAVDAFAREEERRAAEREALN
jgi:hypothetical protein